jgi:outer membrane murein-binding lipoprotein Lpp
MNLTKVLSARVPFESYIDVIRRAGNANLSVSDYIISALSIGTEKLSVSNKSETNGLIEQLTAKNEQLESTIQNLVSEKEQLEMDLFYINSANEQRELFVRDVINENQQLRQDRKIEVEAMREKIFKANMDFAGQIQVEQQKLLEANQKADFVKKEFTKFIETHTFYIRETHKMVDKLSISEDNKYQFKKFGNQGLFTPFSFDSLRETD